MFVDFDSLPGKLKSEIRMRDLLRAPVVIVPGAQSPKPEKSPYWHFEIGIEWIENLERSKGMDSLVSRYHAIQIGATP